MNFDVNHPEVIEAVRRALAEDVGTGDVTTRACVPNGQRAAGRFVARQPMIVAGTELLTLIYDVRGSEVQVDVLKRSGEEAEAGDTLAVVSGAARPLLTCERVALNFLQLLCGVATLARQYVDAVAGMRCQVLDTRKTTPGLRRLEKMAAAAGGVVNHRMGLYDAILIKNNHTAAAGGLRSALERTRATGLPVEIEIHSLAELDEALACGADHLLLDNLTPEQAAEQIRYINGRATVELSGGITLENIRAYAETGADFVSCGAITHSTPACDIAFRLEP
jgi:nicotinate-nucleotide pyrophosphorylase (carboxylating)